ncbi:unknown [Firmicutes bacterium CAG:240]|nr:unknown [Firmicutes bacterium CAG:240]
MQRGRNKIAGMDVPCAGNYLHRLCLTDVDQADPHMVGVGVLFHGEDLADENVIYFCSKILIGLDLRAGEGHSLGKLAVVYIADGNAVNKLSEPFSA